MLNDKRLKIVDCLKVGIAPGVDIAGGVYFCGIKIIKETVNLLQTLMEKSIIKRDLSENDILIRDVVGLSIIDKIRLKTNSFFAEVVSSNPFGFESKARGDSNEETTLQHFIN